MIPSQKTRLEIIGFFVCVVSIRRHMILISLAIFTALNNIKGKEMGFEKNIVIIGGGFAGLNAAVILSKKNVNVTLIDKRNFHLFQPLLYQVASGGLSPADIAFPLRAIFKNKKNVNIVHAEVIDVEFENHLVITSKQKIKYDFLILAAGAKTHYYGKNEWTKYSYGLKSIEDATSIRNLILSSFEKAELESDVEKKKQYMTFAIIGGGPAGVELSGAIAELARMTLHCDFRNINTNEAKILLIEGTNRILPTYPDSLSQKAKSNLEQLGVSVITNSFVKRIEQSVIELNSIDVTKIIKANIVIWTAGVRVENLIEKISKKYNLDVDKGGRIIANRFCELTDYSNVYVIGDIANISTKDDIPLPGTAPVAMQQGKYVAKRIYQLLTNKKSLRPFRYFDKGNLAVIGRKAAVAYRNEIWMSGFPAWFIWLFVHLLYLIGFENRILVSIQWAFNYFTTHKSARLIANNINQSPYETK
ncbi:MAG: FAD-dependent oxidoreductase [Ignavibacteriales bacterium CG_4_9_14_3_um_filter_34_10]|nr:MAG: FAD-dependent oxidoreductase [Ignavibacteriales bacterium CG_4_9_14_3_um_filter_34_10]